MTRAIRAIWMPHPGHFICAADCRFHLSTYVNGYLISTVGERIPDSAVRKILRESRGRITELKGEAEEADFGFEEIGPQRLYETMVFHAMPAKEKGSCCPYRMKSGTEIEMRGYNKANEAYRGHLALVEKFARRKRRII